MVIRLEMSLEMMGRALLYTFPVSQVTKVNKRWQNINATAGYCETFCLLII